MDVAYLSASSTLLLVHRSPSTSDEERALCLLSIDAEAMEKREELGPSVPLSVDPDIIDFELVTSLPGENAYPCTLCALFSRKAGAAYIVEGTV